MKLDIYYYILSRSKTLIDQFQSLAYGVIEEQLAEYPYPDLVDDVEFYFSSREEVIAYCLANINSEYSIYWNVDKDKQLDDHSISLTFVNSAGVLFGIHCDEKHVDIAKSRLRLLDQNGELRIFSNFPPARTIDELREMGIEGANKCSGPN